MADFADLTSTLRKTRGDIPPPLVGSSVTLVSDAVYVFGGRPVESRSMVSTLFCLDLRTLVWSRIPPALAASSNPRPPTDSLPYLASPTAPPTDGPSARYFHSAEAWGDKLVVFGGQSYVSDDKAWPQDADASDEASTSSGHLETLDELWIFDTVSRKWSSPVTTTRGAAARPTPRYAHLAVVATVSSEPPVPGFEQSAPPPSASSRLVVIGGQDYQNNYLSEMSVLDLDEMEWIGQAPYPRKAGTYRSVASTAKSSLAPLETRLGSDGDAVYSSHSLASTEDNPEPIFVYSNSNFASPRRDLDLIPSPLESFTTPSYLSVSDRMAGDPSLPPGIRFPRLYSCGSRNLVLSGAHVGVNRAEFVLWALDLGERGGAGALRGGERMVWSRLNIDKVFGTGSWGPAVGWRNTLVVCGDKDRDMMTDYNSRQTNFSHVVFVDLESFGIYDPPPQPLPPTAQTLGLLTLSQPRMFDFEIICSDRERLGCCRSILESRWPWFAAELEAISAKSTAAVEAQETLTMGDPHGEEMSDEEPMDRLHTPASSRPSTSLARPIAPTGRASSRRLFPITAHSLELPLPSPDVKAILQYFHTLALSTPLQRSIPILSSLLNFDKAHDILPNLRALVVHALHESLDPGNAAKIYEAAAVGRSMALQIRAMQVMLANGPESESPSNRSRENSIISYSMSQRHSDGSHPSSVYSGREDAESTFPRSPSVSPGASPYMHSAAFVAQSLPSPPPSTTLPPPPPTTSPSPPSTSQGLRPSAYPARSASRNASIDTTLSSGLPCSPAMNFPHPPARPSIPPVAAPPSIPISSNTPSRIAEAWREGEERDRRQRAEQARLEAEAGLARMRLASERKGSIATTMTTSSGASSLDPPNQQSGTLSTDPSTAAFSLSPTGSVSNLYRRDSDVSSFRTTSSGGDSGHTQTSSEKAAKAGHVAAKVIKKGFLAGLLAQPEFHQSGTKAAPVATGPPVRKVYPAPKPRYPQKGKKGASDTGSLASGKS
ncbi:hypothetical protein JCM10212_003553 [Sporobolomyces blumeae]